MPVSKSVNTIDELKSLVATNNQEVYCAELRTRYRYYLSGGSYLANGTSVILPNLGGTTRWVGISGKYQYNPVIDPGELPAGDVVSQNLTVDSLSELQSLSGVHGRVVRCLETRTSYRYFSTNTGLTANGSSVLITGAGGTTRWVGVEGPQAFVNLINRTAGENSLGFNLDGNFTSAGGGGGGGSGAAYPDNVTVASSPGIFPLTSANQGFITAVVPGVEFVLPDTAEDGEIYRFIDGGQEYTVTTSTGLLTLGGSSFVVAGNGRKVTVLAYNFLPFPGLVWNHIAPDSYHVWSTNINYRKGELVEYPSASGILYISGQNSNLGVTPGTAIDNWYRLTGVLSPLVVVNETVNRAVDTVYNNDFLPSQAITVYIRVSHPRGNNGEVGVSSVTLTTVSGPEDVASFDPGPSVIAGATLSPITYTYTIIVPPGATYELKTTGSTVGYEPSITSWHESRSAQ